MGVGVGEGAPRGCWRGVPWTPPTTGTDDRLETQPSDNTWVMRIDEALEKSQRHLLLVVWLFG